MSSPPARRLYRSSTDRLICGVCGGLADYFGLDSKMVRIVAVILLFVTGGSAAIGYLLAMLLIPEENVSV